MKTVEVYELNSPKHKMYRIDLMDTGNVVVLVTDQGVTIEAINNVTFEKVLKTYNFCECVLN
jgi:hypothetical protein